MTKRSSGASEAAPAPKQQKTLTSFFGGDTRGEDATVERVIWSDKGAFVVGEFMKQTPAPLVAAYDFDDTLVTANGTHTFSKDPNDWKPFAPNVLSTLRETAKTHRIVVFTNQGSYRKEKSKKTGHSYAAIFRGKAEGFARQLNVPMLFLVACEHDEYRKPRTGLWDEFVRRNQIPEGVNLADSFFVGDAAGRKKNQLRKHGDHSDCDFKFASNIGLPYRLPEQVFLGQRDAQEHIPEFEFQPAKIARAWTEPEHEIPLFLPSSTPLIAETQPEVVVFVGPPAAGKTTFFKRHLEGSGYVHINQDTLKTREKCIKAAEHALLEGRSVAIDNTNPDKPTRKFYVALAEKHGMQARAFNFSASLELSQHNSIYRAISKKEEGRTILPDIAFTSFRSRHVPADISEGFAEVKTINFVPHFDNDEERQKWMKWH